MNHSGLPPALVRKFADRPEILDAHAAQRAGRARPSSSSQLGRCQVLDADLDEWAFVRTEQLARDAERLVPELVGVDLIVGVARSGLFPAGVVAYHLHRPLWSVSTSAGLVDVGHGVRLEGMRPEVKRIALIDDTAARGVAMGEAAAIVAKRWPAAELVRAVVYAHPHGAPAVDLAVRIYPGLHYLAWNWCNAGHGVGCAYDFDGILCLDPPAGLDESGPAYDAALAAAVPLFLPRRAAIPLIVTARPERSRALTLDWLDRHGVKVDELMMRGWEWGPGEWCDTRVGEWKAEVFGRSGLTMFAESTPAQAEIIALASGKPVLCPAAGRVITSRPDPAAVRAIKARQRRCPHAATTACACECKWLGRRVHVWDDCRRCDHLPTEEESHGTHPRMETEARGP
jgi:hypoxanthine phosphoribosyltransferase